MSKEANVTKVLKAEENSRKEGKIRFNPYATKVLSRQVRFSLGEQVIEQGFLYLGFLESYEAAGKIKIPFWVIVLEKNRLYPGAVLDSGQRDYSDHCAAD